VVDAVGGTSVEAHRAGLERIVQAGAPPTSVVQADVWNCSGIGRAQRLCSRSGRFFLRLKADSSSLALTYLQRVCVYVTTCN